MSKVQFYRYFFGFRPPAYVLMAIAAEAQRLGIAIQADKLMQLHLTLCVIDELPWPDAFMARRADAVLTKSQLSSCSVNLGRLYAGPNGAILRAVGSQNEIRDFYGQLITLIGERGLIPMYRKSGLNAHITLTHGPSADLKCKMPVWWYPDELLLIESHVGVGRHVVVGRWPLLLPPQGELGLCA